MLIAHCGSLWLSFSPLLQGFDPLHRTNLNKPSSSSSNASSSSEAAAASAAAAAAEDPSLPPIFDRTPTEGLAAVYTLLKKAIASRKNICKILALDLLAVDQIGIFARQKDLAQTVHQLQTSDAMDVQTIGESPAKAAASLDPPATLGRSLSLNSVGVASPMEPATPTGGSQEGDYPAFVPPLIERASAPRLPPTGLAQSMGMASPATVSSASSGELITQAKETSANPLAFLAYTAGLITGFPFEDDEPLQLCAHLSKVINTHGAALQTQMQQTIIALKKLNGEHVNENDEEEVSQLAQPMETGGTQASAAPTPLPDKASLLQSLALQGESAMAITILIQLRQWLQKSYELAGLFETWSAHKR
jgi:hypothetical protein